MPTAQLFASVKSLVGSSSKDKRNRQKPLRPLGMKLLPWSARQEIPQEPLRTISVARKEVLVRDTSRASHTSISKGMFS
jgi:hypothetical protein